MKKRFYNGQPVTDKSGKLSGVIIGDVGISAKWCKVASEGATQTVPVQEIRRK